MFAFICHLPLVWQSIFSFELCCHYTRKSPWYEYQGLIRAQNKVKRRITWVLLYHMVMRVVHGPGFRLCVFGYNRFWAQKTGPHIPKMECRGQCVENRTTRNMRRCDLLETSLPQQRVQRKCGLRNGLGRGLRGSHHLLGLLVAPSNRRSVPRQR